MFQVPRIAVAVEKLAFGIGMRTPACMYLDVIGGSQLDILQWGRQCGAISFGSLGVG